MVLTDTAAVLFFPIATGLGVCFVWAFWEIEQGRQRRSYVRRIHAWRQIR